MKTVILHGILAKKFGKSFRLDVKTAKEACHALACQIPTFYAFMMNAEKQGIKFAIFNGEKRTQKTNIGEKQVDDITTASHIHIMPRVIGSGGKTMGWLQVVAGWVLVGVGVVTGNAGLIAAGAGLMLGGVSSLLMPTPKLDPNNEDGNRPNNGFGGAITTVAQGNPVPILYGEREIGGFIVSAAIYAEDKMVQGVKV
ncbi:tail assembly protein [Moraxella catarrhalis]|uniref:tail assembly protein n=1 Tax=Moraxella catarrhalis TaxID=480 RepID=UPI000666AE0B|nr:tail assembly protein [Moraxella catarrhalis]